MHKSILLLLLLGAPISRVAGQVSVAPILAPRVQLSNSNGLPCVGCKLYSYAAGTTNPLATYTDSTGTVVNANPTVLDSTGGASVWIAQGTAYKFVLNDASGNQLWSVDNVTNPSQITTLKLVTDPWMDVRAKGGDCTGNAGSAAFIESALASSKSEEMPAGCILKAERQIRIE